MNLARAIAELAIKIAPTEDRPWAAAMKVELDYVPAASTLAFACGALMTATRLRIASPVFVEGFARYGLAASALLWSGLQVHLAMKLGALEPASPTLILFAAALVFAIGGLTTAVAGLLSTIRLAVPALALAAIYAACVGVLIPQSTHRALYQALAFEDAFALLTALLLALAARRYVDRQTEGPA